MNITCKDLSIGYNNVPLHNNINVTIPSGAYVCIVGDNGAGKSTLVKTILGLIPVVNGSVNVGEINNYSYIGYLPQQTQVQKDFPASVYEVVISGCLNKIGFRPFYNKAEKALAKDMLTKLNIMNLKNRSYSELSGGQQQRVLLARALCATDKILLLDEPTAGLDVDTTEDFYKLTKDINREGTTIIMITHNLKDVIADADYVLSVGGDGVNMVAVQDYAEGMLE